MGNQPTQENFIKDQWELIEKNLTHSVWRNLTQPNLHIEGHDRFSTDEYTYHTDKEIFQLRHNNPYLVAGVYLQQHEQHEFCSTNYKYRIFIEKIPIRLTDIEHIPYPDILHLYNQCLIGYQILSQKIGYHFEVEQSYIGINERGVVKVWLSKYFANSSIIGNKIAQQQMVKSIVDIIDKNSDPYAKKIPNIKKYFYRNTDVLNFVEAKRQLQSYIATFHNNVVPGRLECVEQAGGVYAIANRPQIYHTQQSTVGQPYLNELITQNSRFQSSNHLNRPQLVSNTEISQQESTSRNSFQNVVNMPLKPLATIPSQTNLKNNQNFAQLHPQKVIANPVQVRQSKEVSRRRKSDFETQHLAYSGLPPQSLRNSQTLKQQILLQNRQVNFIRNVPNVRLQNNMQFNSASANQNNPTNANRIGDVISRQSPNNIGGDSTQNMSLKQFNQNGQLPYLPLSGNPSIPLSNNSLDKNFSAATSVMNSYRTNIPSQEQIKTNIQKTNIPNDFTNKQFSNMLQNNSTEGISQYKTLFNQSVPYSYPPSSMLVSFEQKKRQASFTPSLNQQRAQLLASFNPAFTKQNFVFQTQKPIEKKYVPQKIKQNDWSFKQPAQVNPDDGKSSQEFMRKLREINTSFGTTQNQKFKSSFPVEDTPITYNTYSYASNILNQQPNLRSYQQLGTKTPVQSFAKAEDEQFGRNTVSKIIQNNQPSYKNINTFTNNEPLKFQHGLTMKYSRLQVDQPQTLQFKKQAFGTKYESKIDSDLLADLDRLNN